MFKFKKVEEIEFKPKIEFTKFFDYCVNDDIMYVYCEHLYSLNVLQKESKKLTNISQYQPMMGRDNTYTINYYNNNIYLYHSESGLWKYTLKNKYWEQIDGYIEPQPRKNASSVIYKHYLIVFGGCITGYRFRTNAIWIFDTIKNEWFKRVNTRNNPSARSNSKIAIYGDMLIISGGDTGRSNSLRDTYAIDINKLICNNNTTHKWIKMNEILPNTMHVDIMGIYGSTLIFYGLFQEISKPSQITTVVRHWNKIITALNFETYFESSNILSKLINKYFKEHESLFKLSIPNDLKLITQYYCGVFTYQTFIVPISQNRETIKGCILKLANKPRIFITRCIYNFRDICPHFYILS